MGSEHKVFTFAQVSEHNDTKDCWLIINGKVYDVTKYLVDHPGGDDVLVSATGKDATFDFETIGHSAMASELMDQFYVGDIDATTMPEETTDKPPKQPLRSGNQDKSSEFIAKLMLFIVPLVILGLAFGIRFYTKSTSA